MLPYPNYGLNSRSIFNGDFFTIRYGRVSSKNWIKYYQNRICDVKPRNMKDKNGSCQIVRKGKVMSLSVKTRVVRALKAGKSLRQIAATTGVGDVQGKAIYRIGASEGVYSVRSVRNTTTKKSGRKS